MDFIDSRHVYIALFILVTFVLAGIAAAVIEVWKRRSSREKVPLDQRMASIVDR